MSKTSTLKSNSFFLYFLLSSILIIFSVIANEILGIQELITNSLAKQLTNNQLTEVLILQKKWQWLGYAFLPFYILLKLFFVSNILFIGTYFFSKNTLKYKKIINCVLKAEFVFLIIPIFKIIWFYFFQTTYNLDDVQCFYPLSALNIVGYKGLDAWLIYPLQTLNLFEVAYIIYLSYQIGSLTKTNADNGLKIVSYSYVPALLLWVTVVMFFTLNNS